MDYKVFCKFIQGFDLRVLACYIRFAFPQHINYYTLRQNVNCCLKNIYSLFTVRYIQTMQTANTYTKENQHTKKGKCQVNQNSKIQKWKTRQKENKENKKTHTHKGM